MNTIFADRLDLQDTRPQLNPHVDILLLYQDALTGQRAIQLYERLVRQFGSDYLFHFHTFNFKELHNARTQHAAARKAVDADLVVVSAHADGRLPSEITSCLELWFDQRTEAPQTLIALLSTSDGTNSSAYDDLRRAAADAGADFYYEVFPPMAAPVDAPDFFRKIEHAIGTSRWLQEMLQRSQPVHHWGLNE